MIKRSKIHVQSNTNESKIKENNKLIKLKREQNRLDFNDDEQISIWQSVDLILILQFIISFSSFLSIFKI